MNSSLYKYKGKIKNAAAICSGIKVGVNNLSRFRSGQENGIPKS